VTEDPYADLETPSVLVELDVLERNLATMARRARETGTKLRPHTKTHKSAWIAKRQLAHGANGITTAKLGEAEAMAAGGVDDILVAYPVVGRSKLRRLAALVERHAVIVALDDHDVAKGIDEVGASLRTKVPVYLDVDSGHHRCGRVPGLPSALEALRIADLAWVELRGLMTHAGHSYQARSQHELRGIALSEAAALVSTAEETSKRGLVPVELSVGSTPTAHYIEAVRAAHPEITEFRPGTYAFYDADQVAIGVASEDDCALTILTTVVSRPAPDRMVLDAGSKTLSSDAGFAPGFGHIKAEPNALVTMLSEEHATVRVDEGAPWRIGDRVELIPNHACVVVNLTAELFGTRRGAVEETIVVDARGKTR
jgi:D-serine deaminase-like pyridoxal phosphate-dependent protein